MVTAEEFAQKNARAPFGLSRSDAVDALRRLAGEIEAGTVRLSKVHVVGVASPDDFGATRLVLTLHSLRPTSIPSDVR